MKANRPGSPPAVDVTYLNINGNAKAGDTFSLVVRYKVKVLGSIKYTFKFPDQVAPLNQITGEKFRIDTIVSSVIDSVYERTYQVKANGVGKSVVEIEIEHLTPPIKNYVNTRCRKLSPTNNKEL